MESDIADVDGGGAAVCVLGGEFAGLKSRQSHKGLESRSWRVGGSVSARQERDIGIVTDLFVDLWIEDGDKVIGIILGP